MLRGLVARVGGGDGRISCRVITRRQPSGPGIDSERDYAWLSGVSRYEDLDGLEPTGLAVVFDQLEHMEKTAAQHLLAQLRDRYADRVIAIDAMEVFSVGDFLALGFERLEDDTLGRAFIYDPDSPSRQREWNNPDNWANPDNFNKYRW